jgi:hypothetical protein
MGKIKDWATLAPPGKFYWVCGSSASAPTVRNNFGSGARLATAGNGRPSVRPARLGLAGSFHPRIRACASGAGPGSASGIHVSIALSSGAKTISKNNISARLRIMGLSTSEMAEHLTNAASRLGL